MKYFLTLLWALALTLGRGEAAPVDDDLYRAVSEARASVDAAERAAVEAQSLDELNAAAREHVIRELKLSGNKRREFEGLYDAYRKALDNAITPTFDGVMLGEMNQLQHLKTKLANIAAVAQVKREYVDRFAAMLSAEQIRTLYNTEGAIGEQIKQAAANRMPRTSRLRGSGRMATQEWGAAGNYTTLSAGSYCVVTLSPTARTISVTADDNVIDYIEMTNQGGELAFRFSPNANSIEDIHIQITVPFSAALCAVHAKSYGKVIAAAPLKGASMKIEASSYGSISADIETSGATSISVSSYGRFKGEVRGGKVDYNLSSYARAEGVVESRGSCRMEVSSYARFSDDIKASDLSLAISGYAKFTGSVTAAKAQITINSYSSFSGAFVGNSLAATIGSYASMTISGAAQVADAQIALGYNSSFQAPELRVVNYTIKASGVGRVDVWCSGLLKFDAPHQTRLTYDGPCKLDVPAQNVKRRA